MAETKTNRAFQEYATSAAFVITLSKNQIDALCLVVEKGSAQISGMAASALTRRGFIEFEKIDLKPVIINGIRSIRDRYVPTLAGKLMYRLLLESGLWHCPENPMLTCPIDCTKEEWDAVEANEIS